MAISYPELKKEYLALWREMQIATGKLPTIDKIITKAVANKAAYVAVEKATKVPWFVVAAFHNLEASLNFKTHLHNGDPLTARTVHVPKGRPIAGNPPFNWQDSAIDALTFDKLTSHTNWTVQGIAFALEGYNGWGYRKFHAHVKSPYLWSFSSHYVSGKYGSDGKWDESLASEQCGGMVLLNRMQQKGLVELAEDPVGEAKTLVSTASTGVGTGGDILTMAKRHIGEAYVLGASANFLDPNYPGPWDCADFASWVLYQVSGIAFGCTDDGAPAKKLEPYSGSWFKDAKDKGQAIEVTAAKSIPGAFYVRKPKAGKPGHVAISDGDGKTVEAMDSAHGVTQGKVGDRFEIAVLVPGIKY